MEEVARVDLNLNMRNCKMLRLEYATCSSRVRIVMDGEEVEDVDCEPTCTCNSYCRQVR